MSEMSQATGYLGDEALKVRLLELGVTRSFAEVRAMMARDAWSLDPTTLEDTVLAIVAGADEGPLDLALVAQLRALKESLAQHASSDGELFQVAPVEASTSTDGLLQRLADRHAEAAILLGIFSFNRLVHPALFDVVGPLAGSLERAVLGLDKKRLLIEEARDFFEDDAERRMIELAIDEIDQAIGHGFTVAARYIASERIVRLGAKIQQQRAVARHQSVAAAERRKVRRKAEASGRKTSR